MLLMVIAAAALAIAGAAVIILSANQPPRPSPDYSSYTAARSDEPSCTNPVTMTFKTDEAMLQAAPRLERDSRFYNTIRETKAQNYERFKRTFADQPELIALTKPESVPASMTIWMDASAGRRAMLAELRNTYATADVQDPCEITATTTTTTPTR
jgi:hypothetical protein